MCETTRQKKWIFSHSELPAFQLRNRFFTCILYQCLNKAYQTDRAGLPFSSSKDSALHCIYTMQVFSLQKLGINIISTEGEKIKKSVVR